MTNRIFRDFLVRQHAEGLALGAASDLVEVLPLDGTSSARYIVELRCRGLVNEESTVAEADRFAVGFRFPSDYLRRVADAGRLATWLAPDRVWHPNIAPPFICLGKVPPGTGLVDLIYQVWEIITYTRVTPREDDALNRAACKWARANQDRFPVDARPLKRRAVAGPDQCAGRAT